MKNINKFIAKNSLSFLIIVLISCAIIQFSNNETLNNILFIIETVALCLQLYAIIIQAINLNQSKKRLIEHLKEKKNEKHFNNNP